MMKYKIQSVSRNCRSLVRSITRKFESSKDVVKYCKYLDTIEPQYFHYGAALK